MAPKFHAGITRIKGVRKVLRKPNSLEKFLRFGGLDQDWVGGKEDPGRDYIPEQICQIPFQD